MTPWSMLGCGYVGQRLARQVMARGASVEALTRSADSAAALRAAGISARAADVQSDPTPSVAGRLAVYAIPPPASGQTDPRLAHWLERQESLEYLLLISTTGVYGDCGGAWITEDHPLNPQVDRARRRVDAEQRAQAWCAQRRIPLGIIRVPGIYGPGRLPRNRLEQGLPVLAERDSPFSNRIHVDDLVAACLAAVDQRFRGVVHVADGHPTTMTDYFTRVATALGLPPPPQIDRAEAETRLSREMLGYLAESKRLDTTRMREELGVHPRYPDLATGLPHCLS